jgi:hypothetical protein
MIFESCPTKALGAFCMVVIVLIAVVHPLPSRHPGDVLFILYFSFFFVGH